MIARESGQKFAFRCDIERRMLGSLMRSIRSAGGEFPTWVDEEAGPRFLGLFALSQRRGATEVLRSRGFDHVTLLLSKHGCEARDSTSTCKFSASKLYTFCFNIFTSAGLYRKVAMHAHQIPPTHLHLGSQMVLKTDKLDSALPGHENMVFDEHDDPSAWLSTHAGSQ